MQHLVWTHLQCAEHTMTMGWMETIRFIGLDLQVATVFAVATLDVAARALRSAWRRIPPGAPAVGSVRAKARKLHAFPRMHPAEHGVESS
jgi:hypothetical protein